MSICRPVIVLLNFRGFILKIVNGLLGNYSKYLSPVRLISRTFPPKLRMYEMLTKVACVFLGQNFTALLLYVLFFFSSKSRKVCR